jgi:anti-anti-sigma factor
MNRAPSFAPMTPEQHERVNLGLKVDRPADEPTALRISITANLVATNAQPLRTIAFDGIADGRTQIAIDMAHCEYVDGRGFGVLLSVANAVTRAGGSVAIANAGEDIRLLFESHGIAKLFTFTPSEATS